MYYLPQREGQPANLPPVASFTYTIDVLKVSFRSTSTDPEGGSLTHSWDFGDGTSSSEQNPVHQYQAAGKYKVTLKVTDEKGLSSSTTQEVTVGIPDLPPSCSIWLLDKDTGSEIDSISANEFFYIHVIGSDDYGIKEVRFSSDDSQDGNPTGDWTEWLNWDSSSDHRTGYWDAMDKKKEWAFTTPGGKEVWVEVKDSSGQTKKAKADISCYSIYSVPFDLKVDGYSFENIGIRYFKDDILKLLVKSGIGEAPSVLDILVKLMKGIRPTGLCYGMSATSILYKEYPDLKPENKPTYEMEFRNKVKENIINYQISQYPNVFIWMQNLEYFSSRLGDSYKRVEKSIREDKKPIIINMFSSDNKGPGAHAVVAYKIIDYGSEKEVYIYDPNMPYPKNNDDLTKVIFDLGQNKFIGSKYWKDLMGKTHDIVIPYSPHPSDVDFIPDDFMTYLGILVNVLIDSLKKNRLVKLIFHSPVEVLITDQQGRKVGYVNSQPINEIPGSNVEIVEEMKIFYVPADLTYSISVIGTGSGTYGLTAISAKEEAAATIFTASEIPTSSNAVHQYIIDWEALSKGMAGVTLRIDYNGDGEIDATVTSGNQLSKLPLDITTISLPPGVQGASYSQELLATGGVPPYLWSIVDGNLPPGLSIDPEKGIISGVPKDSGSFEFTVEVRDSYTPQQMDKRSLVIIVGFLAKHDERTMVKSEDGRIEIEIPPLCLPKDGWIVINTSPIVDIPQYPKGYYGIRDSLVEIKAYDSDGNRIFGLLNPATLTFHYPDKDQDGSVDGTSPALSEMSLRINEIDGGIWKEVPGSIVDPSGNTVSAQISHLSIYILIGKPIVAPRLENVLVYPNPFNPWKGQVVYFGHPTDPRKKLTGRATISIYNVAGQLIRRIEEPDGDGIADGVAIWDGKDKNGNAVGSGVYIYCITNPHGERCVGRLVVMSFTK